MKPSIHNYALAHTCGFSGAAGIVCALGWLLWALHSEGTLTGGRVAVIWIVIAAIPAAALGWLVGILFPGPFLFQLASRIQGAPFRAGDPVWILAGKHKGTLTHVHEAWKERGQVRVDLGPDAKKKVEDVFCLVAVCRAKGEKGPKRLSEDKKGCVPR